MKTRPFRRILVIKLRAIGDVILATPVAANLRAAYPDATIDFLTEPPAAPLLQGNPHISDVLVFERQRIAKLPLHQQAAAQWRFFRQLRGKKYDLAIDMFGNPRSAIFTLLSGASVRAGFAFRGRRLAYNRVLEPHGDRLHEVEFNLDGLRQLGIATPSTSLEIPIPADAEAFADAFWTEQKLQDTKVVGINSSGGWATKRWPPERFAAVADALVRRYGVRILVLWGPGEKPDADEILRLMQEPAMLAPPTDLRQLAALLKRMDLVISSDSGPMHLAAAVGCSVVGIYGPTQPELQGPWGSGHRIVRKEGLSCLGCNGVVCRIRTHDCMQGLSDGSVLAAADVLLAG